MTDSLFGSACSDGLERVPGGAEYRFAQFLAARLPEIEGSLQISGLGEDRSSQRMQEAVEYTLKQGGKRLRGILVLMMAERFGVSAKSVIPLVRGVEFLHTASLMMDDWPAQDNASLRRNAPTHHLVFGEGLSQLAFTALLMESFSGLEPLTNDFSSDRVLAVVAYWARSIGKDGMSLGQLQDLTSSEDFSDEELEQMIWRKTGLAFEASLLPIGILSGLSEEEIQNISALAFHLGLFYQLQDDLMDLEASPESIGKDVGADAINGRETLARRLGRDKARQAIQQHFDTALKLSKEIPGDNILMEGFLRTLMRRQH